MEHHPLLLLALALALLFLSSAGAASAYAPNTSYYLACGASGSATVPLESPLRTFVPDAPYLTTSNSLALSNPSSSSSAPIYAAARVFNASATYRFPVNSSGTHVLRLHFSPFTTDARNLSAARFSVSVLRGRFVLLDGFSASAPSINEYFLWVDSELDVTFEPSPSSSFAFVSALEVFTAPPELIKNDADLSEALGTGDLTSQALEKVHRVNMGGPKVTPANDSLWRTWIPDDGYLLHPDFALANRTNSEIKYRPDKGMTEEIAPRSVYSTARIMNITDESRQTNLLNFNVTWSFSVIPGYKYVLRLHFNDIVSQSYGNTININVYMDGATEIQTTFRSRQYTDMLGEPFYLSYAVESSSTSRINISIGISSQTTADANAYLNGLEIFKVNNTFGSLNGTSNPFSRSSSGKGTSVAVVVGAAVGGLVAIAAAIVVVFLLRRRRRTQPAPALSKEGTAGSWTPYNPTSANHVGRSSMSSGGSRGPTALPWLNNNNFGLQIPLADIKSATNDFAERHVIGAGGFGKVYRGVLSDGTKVAVKRGSIESKQGFPEFQNEILLLSKIRHKHLVMLIGYCEERSERILVYEYMENGALKDYLYGSPGKPFLSWKQRLQICIGAARGLHYLHTGYSDTIIHRDVKSNNILLDEEYMAKVADFGLSKMGPSGGETHVSTKVKGTFGYVDPEYFKTEKLTDKSDVYSFGVMLFEVLCGRAVVLQGVPREQINLTEWALQWQRRGQVDKIIDQGLVGKINLNSLRKYAETAERCLAEYGMDRPTFADVLWNLEYALELQETELRREPFEDSGAVETEMPLLVAERMPPVVHPAEGHGDTTATSMQYGVGASSVFSQLMENEGR